MATTHRGFRPWIEVLFFYLFHQPLQQHYSSIPFLDVFLSHSFRQHLHSTGSLPLSLVSAVIFADPLEQ